MLSVFHFPTETDDEGAKKQNSTDDGRHMEEPNKDAGKASEGVEEEEPDALPLSVQEQKRRKLTSLEDRPITASSSTSHAAEINIQAKESSLRDHLPGGEEFPLVDAARSRKRKRPASPHAIDSASSLSASSSSTLQASGPNPEADVGGTLTHIECVDFMCHKHMAVPLNGHITFITGPNGSGKSAVIAALQICLGLRARATQRSTDLRGLIRHGCSRAILRVGLRNEGPYAYKPDVYGAEIVVERTIRWQGGSSYKICNGASRKCISTLKRDLMEIIENFGIFVDNACCILDQESAKGFLKGGAAAKYRLFLKATELDRLRRNLTSERSLRAVAKEELKANVAMLPALERELSLAQADLSSLSALQSLADKLAGLRKQLAAARAAEALERLAKAEAVTKAEEKKVAKAKAKREEAKEHVRALRDEERVMVEESAKLARLVDEGKAEMEALMGTLQKKQADKAKLAKVWNARRRQLEVYLGQRKTVEQSLKILHEKASARGIGEKRRENLQEIRQVLTKKTLAEEEVGKVGKQIADESMQKEKRLDDVAEVKRQLKVQRQALAGVQAEMKLLLSTKRNHVARFGQWLPEFLVEIEKNAGSFHRKPIHIGMSVELLKPEFWRPIEKCMHRQLRSFLVCDNHDRMVLRNLALNVGLKWPPPMIVSPFADAKHEAYIMKGYITMMAALSVDDANVFNALVDMCSIERHVLQETSASAMDTTFLGPKGNKTMPAGMLACWDRYGNKFSVRRGSEVKEANMYNLLQTKSRIFAKSVSNEEIVDAYARVDKAMDRVAQTVTKLRTAEAALKASKSKLEKLEATQEQSVEQQSQLEESLHALRQRQNDLADDRATIAIADASDNLAAVTARISTQKQTVIEARQAVDSFELREIGQVEAQIKRHSAKSEGLNRDCMEGITRLQNFRESLEAAIIEEQQARIRLENRTEKQTKAAAAEAKARESWAAFEEVAVKFCRGDRPDASKLLRADTIMKQQDITERQLEIERKKQSTNQGTEELVARARARVRRASASVDRTKRHLAIVKRRLQRLRRECNYRMQRWQDFKQSSMLWTAKSFSQNLSHRGHEGSVIFDDELQEIRFRWKKSARQSGEIDGVTDTMQLSGGEKTFTTLALLIAIGQVMETPFRVMDEFDVFMDPANRAESIKMLVALARDKSVSTRQYIFLTPHDLGMLQDADDLKILEMEHL